MPSDRLPPWCGQRFDSAKNSPARLNSTMARPFTSTSFRPPGLFSDTVATTCLAMSPSLLPVARSRDVGHRDAAVDRLAARLLGVRLLLGRFQHLENAVARDEAHAGVV